jgi:protein TonB
LGNSGHRRPRSRAGVFLAAAVAAHGFAALALDRWLLAGGAGAEVPRGAPERTEFRWARISEPATPPAERSPPPPAPVPVAPEPPAASAFTPLLPPPPAPAADGGVPSLPVLRPAAERAAAGSASVVAGAGVSPPLHLSPPQGFGSEAGVEWVSPESADALLRSVQRDYPLRAREEGLEGDARVAAIVNPDGAVEGVTVLMSSGSDDLDRAAAEALRRARFSNPSGRDARVEITFVFRLIR